MNMVMAMSRGADDFIAKPFDLDVLTARIQAILRRTYSFGTPGNVLEHKGAVLNPSRCTLTWNGHDIDLTKNELRILEILKDLVTWYNVQFKSSHPIKDYFMKLFLDYLNKIKLHILLMIFPTILTGVIFLLYQLPLEPVLYIAVLWVLTWFGACVVGFHNYQKKVHNLQIISAAPDINLARMDAPSNEAETLQQENKEALTELFKIEQYVEMVLGYLRTEDMSSDLKLSRCDLDPIIREQIHKYAGIFISKKLSLTYEGISETVLTDEKWLGFVIGQILSMFGEINDEGQTILIVTHSAQAASHASRVLFIKDGEVFHQIYKGSKSRQEMYQMIADTLTILTTGGEYHA